MPKVPTNAVFSLIRTTQTGSEDGTPIFAREPVRKIRVWWDGDSQPAGMTQVSEVEPDVLIQALMIIPQAQNEIIMEEADEGTVVFDDGTSVDGTWRVLSAHRKARLSGAGNQEVLLQRTIESR
ncbi:MAG: hypothetical protein OXH01_04155 [Bacteroidetes bacterium]|nr:hypothetical protein [Bacteroidota bacterium]